MIILCPSTVKGFQNREWEERKKDCLWSENVPGHHRGLLIKQAKASSVASENPRPGPWATLASTCRKSTTVWKQGLLNPGKHSLTLNLAYLNKTSPWRQNTFWSSFINQESFLYVDSSCLVATDWCVFAIFFFHLVTIRNLTSVHLYQGSGSVFEILVGDLLSLPVKPELKKYSM